MDIFLVLFIGFILMLRTETVTAFRAILYHRDSYSSPLYNPDLSETDTMHRADVHSLNMSNTITINSSPTADIFYYRQYLMQIRLGTPPLNIIAHADTGTDLTWTQCQPCTRCSPQTLPFFHPLASSSYAKVSCNPLKPCPSGTDSECQADGLCHYDMRYIDQTYSKGILSKDTMTMDTTLGGDDVFEVRDFIFGCVTDNVGPGPKSFVAQLGATAMQRFSYCLTRIHNRDGVSHIRFGNDALVQGPKTVTLPFVTKGKASQYYVTLEAFTVYKTRIEFTSVTGLVEEGNIAVDSGTALVWLPRHIYDKIKRVVVKRVKQKPVPSPDKNLDLCFKKDGLLNLPRIVANFRGGDVALERYNAYVGMGSVECLAFKATDELNIYGSWAQQNFIVGYDNMQRTISFISFDCTTF